MQDEGMARDEMDGFDDASGLTSPPSRRSSRSSKHVIGGGSGANDPRYELNSNPLAKRSVHSRLTGPVALELVANIISVHHIDTINQVFSADIVLRGRTHGLNKVVIAAGQDGAGTKPDCTTWEPRLRINNLVKAHQWTMRSTLSRETDEMSFKYVIYALRVITGDCL
jgi:hypothetical protein